jgi:hypothetical protein
VACFDIFLVSGSDKSWEVPVVQALLWRRDRADYYRIFHHCRGTLTALVDSQSEQEAVVEQPPVLSSTQGASFLCLFQPSQTSNAQLSTQQHTIQNLRLKISTPLQDSGAVCAVFDTHLWRAMGSWWRSEEMEYVSVIVSEDAAHSCIRELGQMGKPFH